MIKWVFFQKQYKDYVHRLREQGGIWLLWFLVTPVAPILAYAMLGYLKVLPADEIIPRHLYIIVGVTCWLLFSETLVFPSESVYRFKSYFLRREIDLASLLAAWMPERLLVASLQFSFCLMMVFLSIDFCFLYVVYFLAMVFLGFWFFTFLGAFVAVIALMYPGLKNLIITSNRFLLFVSGVIFPLSGNSIVEAIKIFNPYFVFIDGARCLLFGVSVNWTVICGWLFFAIALAAILLVGLERISPEVREYLQ